MAIKIQGTIILDDDRNLLSGNTITATSFVGPLTGNATTVTNGVYTIGDQSIGGVKTFTGIPAFNGGVSGTSAPFTVDSTTVVTNLNADLLDGQNLVSTASTVNTVAGRDGSGDIYARLLRTTYTEDSGITSTAGVHMRVNANTDNYSRIVTGTGFVNWLENYDGAGSGLDADLLDGVQGASYLRSDANDTASGLISFDRGAANYTDAFVLQSGTPAAGNPGLFFKKADSNTVHLTMWNGSTVQGKLFINSPTIEINSTTSVFGHDGTNGYLQLNRGNTTNPGYISFHTPDNVRRSYIGWNNSNQNALVAENGWGWSVTGDVNFDSATMFVDATNNRVGMGTANPKENLHVNGELALGYNNFLSSNLYFDGNFRFISSSGYAGLIKLASGTNDLEISVSNGASTSADSIAGIHRAAIYEMDNKNWLFYTDNVEKMRITGSGNIGIGTDTPSSTAGVDGKAIHVNTGALVGELRFTNDSSGTTVSDGAYLRYDGAAFSLYNMENGYLRFGTNNQERMRIVGADGNVGIGVSVPSEKLHVEGTVRSLTFASANGSASAPAYDFAADPNTGMFLLAADTLGFATNGTAAGAFTSTGDLRLYNTAGNRFITISNQPTANVTITIPVLATNSNFVISEGTATVNGAKTFSDLRISGPLTNTGADGRDKLRVWSSSSYSIGMTPISYGSLGFADGTGDYAMTFQMNNLGTRGFWWGDTTHTDAQGAMALTTDGRLTVANVVRAGYGESDTANSAFSPTLDITGNMQITGADTGGHWINFVETGYNDRFGIGAAFSGVGDQNRFFISANNAGSTPSIGSAVFVIEQSGNVGIGNIAPTTKLDVTGDVTATRLRLTATGDVSNTSTLHALQIGNSTGINLAIDNNEIMVRNNNAGGILFVNRNGSSVRIGKKPDGYDINDVTLEATEIFLNGIVQMTEYASIEGALYMENISPYLFMRNTSTNSQFAFQVDNGLTINGLGGNVMTIDDQGIVGVINDVNMTQTLTTNGASATYFITATFGANNRVAAIGQYKNPVLSSTAGFVRLQTNDGGNAYFWPDDSNVLRVGTAASNIGLANTGTVVGTQTSDERLKDIEPTFRYGIDDVRKLKPIQFRFKKDGIARIGFGAQTTQPIIPESVYDTGECIDGYIQVDENDDMNVVPVSDRTKLAMDYGQIIPVLAAAIQQLDQTVQSLSERITALEVKINNGSS